jgi:hypothetical protein
MSRTWIALAGAAVVLALMLAVWWSARPDDEAPGTIDLVERFPEAEKRTTVDSLRDAFRIVDVTIDGERKRSIFAHAFARIIWRIEVPRGALLTTAMALEPQVWEKGGDGVLFRIGVSDGKTYEELFKQHIDPHGQPGDRRWHPVTIDLSAWAGQQIDLILNTDAGPAGDVIFDWALWGAPRVTVAADTE